jgi:DNA-binding transcriptional MocR family regulator
VAREKIAVSLSACVPAQLALAGYLKHASFDKHLRRLRQTLASRQATLVRALAHYFPPGTLATQPKGGYFLWVEVPGEHDVLAIQRQAMASGVSFAPGPMFSATGEFRNCLRLNYGHPWDAQAERSIETLGKMFLKTARSDAARVAVAA